MAPTIVRDGQFRLFFFSREETRIHVHVAHPDGEAKFWFTPEVTLATHTGFSATQLRDAWAVAIAHIKEIENAWKRGVEPSLQSKCLWVIAEFQRMGDKVNRLMITDPDGKPIAFSEAIDPGLAQ